MPNKATSSGLKTASAVIAAFPASLATVSITGASGTVIIYDSEDTTTSGRTVLAKIVTGATTDPTVIHTFDTPISANRGLYATLAGGTDFIVTFLPN